MRSASAFSFSMYPTSKQNFFYRFRSLSHIELFLFFRLFHFIYFKNDSLHCWSLITSIVKDRNNLMSNFHLIKFIFLKFLDNKACAASKSNFDDFLDMNKYFARYWMQKLPSFFVQSKFSMTSIMKSIFQYIGTAAILKSLNTWVYT